MSQALQDAASGLRDAARGLVDALEDGDETAIEAAFEIRNQAFERLSDLATGATTDTVRSLVREAAALDASALELARKRLDGIREELSEVRRARAVARSLQSAEAPARFVSKRV